MKSKLYQFLFRILKNVKHSDKIIIKSDCFSKEYENIYQLLDKFHFSTDLSEFYKDYKVDGYNIILSGRNNDTGRSIYIYISK